MYKIDNDNLTQLVVDAVNGVEGAFEELYKQTIKFSYATASAMLKNEEDVEDALQNSYMYVAASIKNLKKPESFMNWLGVIVKHECQKYITKNKRITDIFLTVLRSKEFDSEREETADFDFVEKREITDAVQEIVNKLPDDKRACIVLYYFEQHTLPEISSILGIPEGTVKSRLYSARKFIEKEFSKLRKDDTTLYGISAIPLVIAFLAFRAETAAVPAAIAEGTSVYVAASASVAAVTATTAAASGSAVAATASGASAVAGSAAAGSAIAGSAAAGSAAAVKIAAVVIAASVAVGGGVTTAKHIKESKDVTTVQNIDVTVTEEYATVANTNNSLPKDAQELNVLSDMINSISSVTVPQIDFDFSQSTESIAENATEKSATHKETESTVVQTEEAESTVAKPQENTEEEAAAQQTTEEQTIDNTETETETVSEAEPETETQSETETEEPTTSASDVFSVSNGVLNEYMGDGAAVTVPSSVDSQEVRAIGSGAFAGNTDITSVSLPSSVTRIGQLAFEDCSNLRSVSLSSSLESVGIGAFYGCGSLTQVSIPSGVTAIGDDAFADCTNLSSVTVPESVNSIGDNAFGGCDNVTVKCKEGSAAHNYALANSINYELI